MFICKRMIYRDNKEQWPFLVYICVKKTDTTFRPITDTETKGERRLKASKRRHENTSKNIGFTP